MTDYDFIQRLIGRGSSVVYRDDIMCILESAGPTGAVTRNYVYPDRVLVAVQQFGEEGFCITHRFMLENAVEVGDLVRIQKLGWD
ncbi:hypothetical protein ZPAH1_orf00056 [Aeromonas phage ZPAH1]|nr:hypothetical protein ZPAH1_orf00056 [Aeromonas phage ZPAH1]